MAVVILIFIIFLVSTLLQSIWLLIVFSRLAFYTNPIRRHGPSPKATAVGERLGPWSVAIGASDHRLPETENKKDPAHLEAVSVIICAHNELPNLKQLIPALVTQNHPNFELIIVDDRSKDGTTEWLQSLHFPELTLKLITISNCPQGQNPKKHALIKGINAATHDLILLTDADCYPESNSWISLMSEKFQGNIKIVLGYSGYQSRPGLLNKLIRYETIMTAIQYISRALNKNPYMGVGRNLCYRKSYFLQVKGLQEVLHITGGDDDLFVNKYATGENTAVCLDHGSFIISKPKETWGAYFRQKKRHLSVGKYYTMNDQLVLGIFSVTHIIFWSSLVSLLITSTLVNWVVTGFLVRQLALSLIVEKSSRKLGDHFNISHVPFLDFLYSLFYLYTGIAAWSSSKVNWH
jgi:glycosyltransferase involved in cell wall biosynthesis